MNKQFHRSYYAKQLAGGEVCTGVASRPHVSRIEFRSFQFSVEFPIKEVKFLVNPEMVSIRVQDRGTSTLFCPATQVGGSTGALEMVPKNVLPAGIPQ